MTNTLAILSTAYYFQLKSFCFFPLFLSISSVVIMLISGLFIPIAEQIPWIPHSCYVGERCLPSIGSCINYTEIRECCCDRVLAKRCKTFMCLNYT